MFVPELELELFSSNFRFRAGSGAFKLYFFLSELELEPQSSWGQIGAGSKLEPIVHLWVLTKSAQRAIQSINRHVRRPVCVSVVVSVRPPSLAISPRPKPDCIKPRFVWLSLSPARVARAIFFVNSENLGMRIWRKNCVNYDKIEIAARLRKSHI